MSNSKYSVLLMRDDAGVKRFRLSPVWLKIFIYFIVLLVILAGLGTYAGVRFYREKSLAENRTRSLTQQLNEAKVQLERLENVEKILDSYDTDEIHSMLGSVGVETNAQEQLPPIDLNQIFTKVDTLDAEVDNMKAAVAGRKMTIRFDLLNPQTTKTLAGQAFVELIKSDGTSVNVPTNQNDMSFSIQRFKRMRTTLAIPKDIEDKEVFGIRLLLKSPEGKVIFSEIYPLAYILS